MRRWALALVLGGIIGTGSAHGQGCSQCRESVGQTPGRTQAAYRHGIEVMIAAAACVCGATVLVARRFR